MPTNSDGKPEGGENGEKSSVLQLNVSQSPVLRRTIPESIKCFSTPVRPTTGFASPRPVIATVSVLGSTIGAPAPSSIAQPVITKTGIVQPGNTLTVCAPMASIIRGPVGSHPQPSFSSHATHPSMQATYSSHLPRGAAAVACITTLKSAVATPIPRSHILASNIVSSSSGSYHLMQPRMPGISPLRAPLASVAKPALSSLSSDISHISTSTTSNPTLVLPSSRPGDALRSTVVHGAAVISKSHPFVQHVQQMPSLEKGFYKPNISPSILPSQVSTSSTTHATPHIVGQQSSQPISVTPPSTISLPSSQIHLPIHQHSISIPGPSVGSITPSNVSSSISHSHANLPKVITPVTHYQPSNLAVSSRSFKTVVSQSSTKPVVSAGISPLSSPIPVAKVYPQPLTVITRPSSEVSQHGELNRNPTQTLFVSPTYRTPATHLSVSSNVTSSTSGIAVSVSNTSTVSSNVLMTESRVERPIVGSSSYNFPSGTYYYEPISTVSSTLTMHPLSGSSSTPHTFTAMPANIRTGYVTSHTSPNIRTTSTPVSVNSVMMTVTSTRSPQMLTSLSDSSTSLNADSISTMMSTASPATHPSSSLSTSSPAASASSSPRPSILRKRVLDGSQVSSTVKRNLLSCLSPSKLSTSTQSEASTVIIQQSKTASDRDTSSENGQASEGVSSTSSAGITIKQEFMDTSESIATSVASLLQLGPGVEASPRKKPRKQQLTGNELVETHSTEGEEEFEKDSKVIVKKEIIQEDKGSWISRKNRSPVTLLNSYRHTWKSRHNHFLRYTDVKPREERRPTIFELANQKWVTQKVNGWKVHHLCAQMEDVVELEGSVHSRLMSMLEGMEKNEKSKEDDDLDRTIELMRGNIQRCKLIREQMKDAKLQILKVLDHKTRVAEIVSRYTPKQSSRRREKIVLF